MRKRLPQGAPLTLAIHWPRFGPYHLARLRAAQARLSEAGAHVVGVEVASRDKTYLWREEGSPGPARRVILPGRTYEETPPHTIWRRALATLNALGPSAIAINGYSSHDAWALLAWSRAHRCPAILMADSKADDAPRSRWKERVKGWLIGQFSAALCGGTPHRAYLEELGFEAGRIFVGYDVVDNAYFAREAARARRDPAAAGRLPGLEDPTPFFLACARFVQRKNLDGLLRAYGRYRCSFPPGNGRTPWRLVILGDGGERNRLLRLAGELGLDGVSWPGFRQVDELPAYYGLAGAFIHPPLQEQWGLVVNEAMAAGLPVLVSNRCGCAMDLVGEGENGFTFDPEDPDALAALMLRLSCGQVDLAALGRASQARIADWGPERFAEGLYQALRVALPARLPDDACGVSGAGRPTHRPRTLGS